MKRKILAVAVAVTALLGLGLVTAAPASATTVQTIGTTLHIAAYPGTPAFDVRFTINIELGNGDPQFQQDRVYPVATNGIRVYSAYGVHVDVYLLDGTNNGHGACIGEAYAPLTKVCDAGVFDLTWYPGSAGMHFAAYVYRGGVLKGVGLFWYPNVP